MSSKIDKENIKAILKAKQITTFDKKGREFVITLDEGRRINRIMQRINGMLGGIARWSKASQKEKNKVGKNLVKARKNYQQK